MKYALTALVIIATLSVALFAFGAMRHTNHNYYGCVAATAQGAVCPEGANALDFISFHASAFRSFSTGVAGAAMTVFVALLLLMAARARLFSSVFRSDVLLPRYANVHAGLAQFLTTRKVTRYRALKAPAEAAPAL